MMKDCFNLVETEVGARERAVFLGAREPPIALEYDQLIRRNFRLNFKRDLQEIQKSPNHMLRAVTLCFCYYATPESYLEITLGD